MEGGGAGGSEWKGVEWVILSGRGWSGWVLYKCISE